MFLYALQEGVLVIKFNSKSRVQIIGYFHPTFSSTDFSLTSGLNFGNAYQNLIWPDEQMKSLELKRKPSKTLTVHFACQRKCLLSCHEYIDWKLLTSQSSGQGNN